jgi:hypothetical protein
MTEKDRAHIDMMRDVFEVSSAHGLKSYVWGGFCVDILRGDWTRAHGDLDLFCENLVDHLDALRAAYEARGYETKYLPDFWMLQIRKGGVHAGFNMVRNVDGIAHWHHIGIHGAVFFPFEWLDETPTDFFGAKVYTVGLRLACALKAHPRLLSPEWTGREKDRADFAVLAELLRGQGIESADFMEHVWAHNPFWYARGYAEYELPIAASPSKNPEKSS